MREYKFNHFAWFVIVYIIATTTAFSQPNTLVTPGNNTFDLRVNLVRGAESNLEIRWYPPEGLDNFVIQIRNQDTDESRQLSVSGQNFIELGGINPDNDYSVSVFAIDAAERIIAQTPVEKWLGKKSLRILYERAASRPLLNMLTPIISTTLISLESSTFPFIFATIKVDTNEKAIDDLTPANFGVFEDGILQTNFYDVTPVNGGNNRIVDFIFLVDNSGSMCPKQQSVIENINVFIDSLTATLIDVRLGAVRFGQLDGDGQPILMNDGNMTEDVDLFKGFFAQMTCDGGDKEPGIEAVFQAATSFSFRPGSQRHFLLITDEDSDGGDPGQTEVVCHSNGITVHVAVDTSFGTTIIDYSGPNSIRDATNGEFFDVMGTFKTILTKINEAIRSTYIVRYRALNDIFNAQQRELRIEVNAFEQSDSITGYYTPGAAPIVQRTQTTVALSNSAKIAGTPLTIEARITDTVSPFVQSATLFYRTSSTKFYLPIPMIFMSSNTYEITIPDTAVVTPSVDYYIIATDGQATSSEPAIDPGTLPYQIAILPNQPSNITHSPVTNGSPGEDVTVSASVVDSTNYLDKVELHYREIGMLLFDSAPMTSVGGSLFEGLIPGDIITYEGTEYFIRAVDNLGFASKHGIHTIFPTDCFSSLIDDFSDGNPHGWVPNDILKWDVEQYSGDFAYRLLESNDTGDEYSLLPINWKDFVLNLNALAIDSQNFFIIFGVNKFTNSTTNSYYLSFASNGVELNYSAADSVIKLASAPDDFVSDSQFHHIQITREFPGIEVSVDGQVLFTVNDEKFSTGCIGIGAYKSRAFFDDINITGSECSNAIYAAISVPSDLKVKAGNMLRVPIKVSSLKDISLAQFTIEYDGNDLQFDNAIIASDVSGFTISQLSLNPPFTPMTPGTNQNVIVRIAGENSAYFTGSGKEVVYLFFTVIGNVEGTSPLAIDPEYSHTFLTSKDSEGLVSNQILFSNGDVTIVAITDIETTVPNQLPSEFALLQNYPNPFNPETTIEFQIPNKAMVELRIYNLRGQEITTLVNAEKEAGIFRISWNGKDSFGRQVSTGIYIYQIIAGDYVESRKLILLR